MRKLFRVLIAAFALTGVSGSWMAGQDFSIDKKEIKARHKAERRVLKLQYKAWKDSFKGQEIPKGERIRMKHQLQREERELRERQRDELQDLKDRQRIQKESQERF